MSDRRHCPTRGRRRAALGIRKPDEGPMSKLRRHYSGPTSVCFQCCWLWNLNTTAFCLVRSMFCINYMC